MHMIKSGKGSGEVSRGRIPKKVCAQALPMSSIINMQTGVSTLFKIYKAPISHAISESCNTDTNTVFCCKENTARDSTQGNTTQCTCGE